MWDELGRRYGVRKVGSQRVSCGTGGFLIFFQFFTSQFLLVEGS